MTVPAVIGSNQVDDTSAGTTGQGGPVVSYSAGDRVLLFIASDGSNETLTPADLAGGGSFASFFHSAAQSDAHTIAGFYADASGAATDDTLNYNIGSSEESNAAAYVLDAGTFDPATAPSGTVTGITAATTDPDPPSHTPAWDASTDDTLWGVFIGWDNATTAISWAGWTGGGSSFPDQRIAATGQAGGCGLALAVAATDPDVDTLNPAVFTNAMSGNEEWCAATWTVRGTTTAPVQSSSAAADGATSVGLTLDSSPTQGNLIVCFLATRGSTQPSTATLPSGYSVGREQENTTESDWLGIYYKIAGASESATITFAGLASDLHLLVVEEYAPPDGYSWTALDVAASTGRTIGTTIASGTTGTTSQADEMAFAMLFARADISNPTVDSGFFAQSDVYNAGGGGTPTEIVTAHKTLTGTGTVATTYTWTTSATALAGVATFTFDAAAAVELVSTVTGSAAVATTLDQIQVAAFVFTGAAGFGGAGTRLRQDHYLVGSIPYG